MQRLTVPSHSVRFKGFVAVSMSPIALFEVEAAVDQAPRWQMVTSNILGTGFKTYAPIHITRTMFPEAALVSPFVAREII
jgi:hypothetical protein